MIQVKAWQHIYTHVEKESSPRCEAGFQTLCYSQAGLSRDDLRLLEQRAFFDVQDNAPVRRQSYPLDGNRWVLGQMLPLLEPDRYGRGGRYLVHNIILDSSEWKKLACNPFPVFAIFPFITGVEQALEKGDLRSGDISPIHIDIQLLDECDLLNERSKRWTSASLANLGWQALRAQDLLANRKTLAIQMPSEQLGPLIELAILLAPQWTRASCSFDTYFHRCNPARTPVWMAGFEDSPGPEFMRLKAGPTEASGGLALNPETAFEHWWLGCIESQEWEELIYNQPLALALEKAMLGSLTETERDLIRRTDPYQFKFFTSLNKAAAEKKILDTLAGYLPPYLVRILATDYTANPDTLWNTILHGIDAKKIAEQTYQVLRKQVNMPENEMRGLEKLAQRTQHKGLTYLMLFWQRTKNSKAWRSLLEKLSPEEYQQLGVDLWENSDFRAEDYWCDKKARLWVDLFGDTLSEEIILQFIDRLVEIKNGAVLDSLAARVITLSTPTQQTIKKMLHSNPHLAPKLWKQLSNVVDQKNSWFSRK